MNTNIPKNKFVIRDDDLSAFNSSEDIKQWYADIFAMDIPVGFSTIPFVTDASDLHGRGGQTGREHPISENQELIEYVKSNPLIEIMQHGCNHENVAGKYEYQADRGLFEKTLKGKYELERAFGKPVSVFVPPHDQISNHGIFAIEHAKLNIIRSKGSKNFLPRISYIAGIAKMAAHILTFNVMRKTLPAYPHTINFKKHQEAFSMRVELGISELFRMMKWSFDQGGNFVVVTHINDMNDEKKATLLACIREAKRIGFEFAKPSELFYEQD